MILFAMALAAFPPLDPATAQKHCESKADTAIKKDEGAQSLDKCLNEQALEHRRFRLLAAQKTADFEKPFATCIHRWTENGLIDWNMAAFCASSQVTDRSVFRLLYADVTADLRPSLDHCIVEESEEGVPDWSDIRDCAEYQIRGKQDLKLLRKESGDRDGAAFQECETHWIDEDDGSRDWRMMASCVEERIEPIESQG